MPHASDKLGVQKWDTSQIRQNEVRTAANKIYHIILAYCLGKAGSVSCRITHNDLTISLELLRQPTVLLFLWFPSFTVLHCRGITLQSKSPPLPVSSWMYRQWSGCNGSLAQEDRSNRLSQRGQNNIRTDTGRRGLKGTICGHIDQPYYCTALGLGTVDE